MIDRLELRAAAVQGRDGRGNERQRLVRRDAREHLLACRLRGRHVHVAAPVALQRAHPLNGSDALDPELVALFEIIDSSLGGITLSYFESSTVAALLHFARSSVDVAVLEVGMGGRLDASNTVDTDCALVVSVDLDHREWLGDDREAIGREKAGIMRRGKPVGSRIEIAPRVCWRTRRPRARSRF